MYNKIREAIDKTIVCDKTIIRLYAKKINDKDILVIDDTITYGQSIIETCKEILDNYNPKSITVLTLISKKYPKM